MRNGLIASLSLQVLSVSCQRVGNKSFWFVVNQSSQTCSLTVTNGRATMPVIYRQNEMQQSN